MQRSLLSTCVLVALLLTRAHAANYYVANSGSDSNAGTSSNAPFRTVAHAMAVEGSSDTVYLQRGDVFREGGLSLNGDMNAYGNPNDPLPVICGSVAITNWSVYSGSIYVADVAETIEHLFVDNALMTIARYPNTGWITPDTYDENNDGSGTIITATQLGLNPRNANGYWDGAMIRWRRHSWWFETRTVTQYYSFGYLYLAGNSIIHILQYYRNFKFYLDHKFEELDTAREWFFDSSAQKVYLWAPTGANPNSLLVEGMYRDTGLSVSSGSEVRNICFRHYRNWALSMGGGAPVIEYCRFEYTGRDGDETDSGGGTGINGSWGIGNAYIAHCTFFSNLNAAISWNQNNAYAGTGAIFEFNDFIHNGCVDGYGGSGPWKAMAIVSPNARNLHVQKNNFFGAGYAGIIFGSDHNYAEFNYMTNCMHTLNDGGAIYCNASENIIRNNIIVHTDAGMESSGTWANLGQGIWPEFLSEFHDSVIVSNTVAFSGCHGLFLQNNFNCIVKDNIFYGSGRDPEPNRVNAGMYLGGRNVYTPQNHVIENNVSFATNSLRRTLRYDDGYDYGSLVSNYWCNPFTASHISEGSTPRTISAWQSTESWADDYALTDIRMSDQTSALFINPTFAPTNIPLNGTYRALDGTIVLHSLPLDVFEGRVLMYLGSSLPGATVSMASPGLPGAVVGQPIEFLSASSLDGTARIGVGQSTDGGDWSWVGQGATNVTAGHAATGSVWMTAGRYYFGSHWSCPYEAGTLGIFGLTTTGDTDMTSMQTASQYLDVTNSPYCGAAWDFSGSSTTPYFGDLSGTCTLASGLSQNWSVPGVMRVSGFPGGTADKSKYVTFSVSTAGRVDIGFFARIQRDSSGPKQVDVQYTTNGSTWVSYIAGFDLDEADTWYFLGGKPGDAGLGANPNAAFRIIGYDAGGGVLGLDETEIAAFAPEPGGVIGAVILLALLRRRAEK